MAQPSFKSLQRMFDSCGITLMRYAGDKSYRINFKHDNDNEATAQYRDTLLGAVAQCMAMAEELNRSRQI